MSRSRSDFRVWVLTCQRIESAQVRITEDFDLHEPRDFALSQIHLHRDFSSDAGGAVWDKEKAAFAFGGRTILQKMARVNTFCLN